MRLPRKGSITVTLLATSILSLAAGLAALVPLSREPAGVPSAGILPLPSLPNLFPTTTAPAPPPPPDTTTPSTITTTPFPAPDTTVPDEPPPPGVDPGDPRYPGQPLHTKLRLTLESEVDWAVADLRGVGYVIGDVVEGGSRAGVQRDGVSLVGPGRAVVDIVVTLPDDDVEARVCKASGGTVRLTVTRIAGPASPVGEVVDVVEGDRITDGCANRAAATLPQAALAPVGAWPVPVDDRRLVLGFFYHYWDADSFDPNPWIETPFPPYDTVNALRDVIDLAQGAGLDGFISSYQDDPNTAGRWEQLVDTAESEDGFTVAPLLEVSTLAATVTPKQPVAVQELEDWFRDVLAPVDSPAFLTVGGRPVVFMFGTRDVSPAVLAAVRSNLRATGLDPFIVGDSLDLAYGLEGFYTYTPNVVADAAELPDWMWQLSRTTRFERYRGMGDRPALLASPVSPGEDDSRVPPGTGTLGLRVDRAGGARYDATWAAALATRPDWVVVSSWNSFIEDTQITPGEVHGTRALEQTRDWAHLFHTG